MRGLHGDRFQNEEIERALNEIGRPGHTPRLSTIVDDHHVDTFGSFRSVPAIDAHTVARPETARPARRVRTDTRNQQSPPCTLIPVFSAPRRSTQNSSPKCPSFVVEVFC